VASPLSNLSSPWADPAMRAAVAHKLCRPPECGGSLRPWAPLFVPPRLDGATLDILLYALVALDRNYLIEHPDTPPLYSAGVRYMREPPGQEQWLTIPWVRMRGNGDCEDLACWRAAELQVRLGERAEAFWVERTDPTTGARFYHIRVRRGKVDKRTGKRLVEDPSAVLGMGTADSELFVERAWVGNPEGDGVDWLEQFVTDGERM